MDIFCSIQGNFCIVLNPVLDANVVKGGEFLVQSAAVLFTETGMLVNLIFLAFNFIDKELVLP